MTISNLKCPNVMIVDSDHMMNSLPNSISLTDWDLAPNSSESRKPLERAVFKIEDLLDHDLTLQLSNSRSQ